MSFDRAQWPVKERGDFGVAEALLIAQVQGELLVGGEPLHRHREIVAQVRFGGAGGDGDEDGVR